MKRIPMKTGPPTGILKEDLYHHLPQLPYLGLRGPFLVIIGMI